MSDLDQLSHRIEQAVRRHDRRRLHRSPTLLGHAFLALLDRACLHTTELCRSYGGPGPDGSARLCDKPRWHWDSHTYGRYERTDGSVVDMAEWKARNRWLP